ncbi:MAG TPA: phosphotransferase [Clostridia bacterium]|nr:phosphotransferase [Clostridia bacterium]
MTDQLITTILEKEGLQHLPAQPLSGGQVNRIYAIGEGMVLRMGKTPQDNFRLLQEAALLRRIGSAAPVPEILSVGEEGGIAYQLQRRLSGQKLHRAWPQLDWDEKEAIMAQLGQHLEALHSITFPTFGWFHEKGCEFATWTEYFDGFFHGTIDGLVGVPDGIPARILAMAEDYYAQHRDLLAESIPALVHADLWPGNVLVDQGRVTGILDFEFAIRAPRDYELVLIEDFCLYPRDFIEADCSPYSAADFADFFNLLRKHTPALFAIPHLRERLNLYHLAFNLNLYLRCRQWNADDSGGYLLAKLARITSVLFDHGTRMFL